MSNPRNFSATLLSNAAATSQPATVPGGRYVWSIQGTWNGATATLQALGPDGTNYMTVTSASADGMAEVIVGQDTAMRVAISGGPPAAVYSTLKAAQ